MAIDPKVQYTRYDVPRAGLRLFSRHAGQFNLYLIDDYEVYVIEVTKFIVIVQTFCLIMAVGGKRIRYAHSRYLGVALTVLIE